MADEEFSAEFVFDASSLEAIAQGLSGGARGAARGMGRGGLGSMGTSLGKIAAGVTAGLAVWDGIKSLMGKLVASSPQLQASMDIMRKSLEFTLRPIGDAIAGALRPFALSWLRFALKWYKDVAPKMQEWFGSLIDNTREFVKNLGGDDGLLGGGIGDLLKNIFTDAIPAQFVDTWNALKDALSSIWKVVSVDLLPLWQLLGATLGLAVVGALKLLEIGFKLLAEAVEFLGPLIGNIAGTILDVLVAAFNAIPEAIESARIAWLTFKDAWKSFFSAELPAAWEKFKERVSEITGKIKDAVVDTWNGLVDSVSGAMSSIRDTIVAAWENIKETLGNIVDGLIERIRSIPVVGSLAGGGTGAEMQDFLVRGNSVIPFSPQDNIMGFKGDTPPMASSGNSTINVTIPINAIDASSISPSVLDRIVEAIDSAQRRGIFSRTMQGVGN